MASEDPQKRSTDSNLSSTYHKWVDEASEKAYQQCFLILLLRYGILMVSGTVSRENAVQGYENCLKDLLEYLAFTWRIRV